MITETLNASARAIKEEALHSAKVFYNLIKIVLPIIIAVKIATELDLIKYIALPLEPLMFVVGLPALIGLAFATGLISGINSAILVYISILPQLGVLSIADNSVFALMLLIAHGLPVEGRVASYCKVSFWGQSLWRLGSAFIAGYILRQIYTYTGTCQEAAQLVWTPPNTADLHSNIWVAWAIQQAHNLCMMALIIFCIMLAMRLLKATNTLKYLHSAVSPVLRLIGISPKASSITVIGMLAGLLYGGGLIMEEVKKGNVAQQDVFAVMSFLALAHSIIEDTLLLMLLGVDFYGIFVFRILFAMLLTSIIVYISKRFRFQPPTNQLGCCHDRT